MSKYPTIPEFSDDLHSMAATVRTLKLVVEILAGQVQGEAYGAPTVYVQEQTPNRQALSTNKTGDLWFNTRTNVLKFWDGRVWKSVVGA